MKETKIKSIRELEVGDIVRHINDSKAYIVHEVNVYRYYAVLIRTINISNPNEWIKIERNIKK